MVPLTLGLGAFLVKRSFFPKNEWNDQERSHCSEKKNAFLKILDRLVKERNGTKRSYFQERVLSWEPI